MEFLVEILLELILEGSIEISSNRKISKWIRYPLIVIIVLFFMVVIIGLVVLGILILENNTFAGLFMIILGLIFLVLGIKKFKDTYIEKKSEKE